jgi:hypothetical protein
MAFQMSDSQQVDVSIAAVDKKGQPAPLESVQWSTDNPNLLALTPSADGKTCTIAAVGPLGSATMTAKADADMDPANTVEIIGTLDVTITGGQAVTVQLVPGTPTEQPPPAPPTP